VVNSISKALCLKQYSLFSGSIYVMLLKTFT